MARRPANRTAELKAKGNSSAAKIDNIVRSISSASLIEPMSIWRARETKQWSQSPDRYRLIAEKMLQQGEPLLAFDVVTEGLSLTQRDRAVIRSTSSKHWIDRHERANEFDDAGHIFGFEFSGPAQTADGSQFAHAKELAVFPNPGVGIIGADAARIGPRVDRQEPIGHRGGDVHRAAVYTDHETRDAN